MIRATQLRPPLAGPIFLGPQSKPLKMCMGVSALVIRSGALFDGESETVVVFPLQFVLEKYYLQLRMIFESPQQEVGRCSWVADDEGSARFVRRGCDLGHFSIEWLLGEDYTVVFCRNIGAIIENVRTAVDSENTLLARESFAKRGKR